MHLIYLVSFLLARHSMLKCVIGLTYKQMDNNKLLLSTNDLGIQKIGIKISLIKRITTGFLAGSAAMVWAAVAQHYIRFTTRTKISSYIITAST